MFLRRLLSTSNHHRNLLPSISPRRVPELPSLRLSRPVIARYTSSSSSSAAKQLAAKMSSGDAVVDALSLTFLGTAAGKPGNGRNVSSIALRLDRDIWVFDAGEATQHQFMKSPLQMGKIRKIFVTHLHGDHVFGIVPLLCTMDATEATLETPRPSSQSADGTPAISTEQVPTEIYGPAGLRELIRGTLKLTYCHLARPYVVHELLFDSDSPEASKDFHSSERQGRNIFQVDGVWKEFVSSRGIVMSAGPILHTIPCIGYVAEELPRPLSIDPSLYRPHLERNKDALALLGIHNPISLLSRLSRDRESVILPDGTILDPPGMGTSRRKVVILGDTYSATRMSHLCMDADLLVHESTNAYLPTLDPTQAPIDAASVDLLQDSVPDPAIRSKALKAAPHLPRGVITQQSVRKTAREHGHSTPEVAGEFAKLIRAKGLVLNHISNKYGAPVEDPEDAAYEVDELKRKMIEEIARLATVAWGVEDGKTAIVARDFLEIFIPRIKG